MTALVFLIALALAWLHWTYADVGWLLWGDVTIYVAASTATLAAACVAAIISQNTRCIYGALVLVVNFTLSHYAWQTADPVLIGAANDLLAAAWFIVFGATRWELTVGGMFLLSVAAGVLTHLGLIPSPEDRAPLFIAWSYPDIVALLAHAANVTLGLGAGDAGRLVRVPLRVRSVAHPLGWRLVARVYPREEVDPD